MLEGGINLIPFAYSSLIFVASGAPQMVPSPPHKAPFPKITISFKTRTLGQFAPSFGCLVLIKLSASGGGLCPLTLDGQKQVGDSNLKKLAFMYVTFPVTYKAQS